MKRWRIKRQVGNKPKHVVSVPWGLFYNLNFKNIIGAATSYKHLAKIVVVAIRDRENPCSLFELLDNELISDGFAGSY
jgi:hypothetical protein